MIEIPGSSPLTRGKPTWLTSWSGSRGLIPAHAGKTSIAMQREGGDGAHPRSRGENTIRHDGDEQVRGSSPLTRGKQGREACGTEVSRLIPAHAGKTADSRTAAIAR